MLRKEYTAESLMEALKPYGKPITATGYLSQYSYNWDINYNNWDINYSSILTALIQSAGRYCQDYASDLFIDWSAIAKRLENNDDRYTDGVYEYLFGIRKSGVDGITFILSQANNKDFGYFSEYYSEIFKLTVTVNAGDMKMELVKVRL